MPIEVDEKELLSIEEMNVAMTSVNKPLLTPAEINFLQRRVDSQSFTPNQFIEVLLLT